MSVFKELQASKVVERRAEIVKTVDSIENFLISRYRKMFEEIWRNGTADPSEIQDLMDQFGPHAAKLFALSNALRQLIATHVPDRADQVNMAVPYDYTINGDGSVTINGMAND